MVQDAYGSKGTVAEEGLKVWLWKAIEGTTTYEGLAVAQMH